MFKDNIWLVYLLVPPNPKKLVEIENAHQTKTQVLRGYPIVV